MSGAAESSKGRRLALNTLLLLGQHGFVTLAGVVAAAFVATRLGPDHYGLFEYCFAFVGGFALVSTFGLRAVTVRAVAQGEGQSKGQGKEEPSHYLGRALSLRVLLAVLALAPLLVTAWWRHHDPLFRLAIAVAALTLPIDAVSTTIRDVFQGLERFDVEALTGVLVRAFTLAGVIAALLAGLGVIAVVSVYAAGSLIRAAIPIFAARRVGLRLRPRWSGRAALHDLRQAAPFAGSAFASLLMWEIDPILLGELGGLAMVGVFAAGVKLIVPLEMIPESLASAMAPTVARGWSQKDPGTEALLQRSFFFLAALGLPVAVGGVLCADLLVALLFGDRYHEAATVLQIVAAALPFEFCSVPAFYALGAIHRQRAAFVATCGGAAVNVGLCLWLIPRHGAIGCAIATASAMVFCFIAAHLVLARHYRVWARGLDYLKLLLANGVMAAAVVGARAWGALAAVAVGAVVYATLVTAMSLVRPRDLRNLLRSPSSEPSGEEASA
ncbi:MAG: flippase [Polyangiaceae bacterium]